jgi:excisionase family DNA binding protein
MERFLKPTEVAARLGISRSAVYELLRRGRLPHVQLGPRIRRVPARALEELAARALEQLEQADEEGSR